MVELPERFTSKVNFDGPGGCWLWTASAQPHNGYGRFWDGARTVMAHRWSYEAHGGAIPDGMQVDHLCRVRACVNPNHLQPVTNDETTRRSVGGIQDLTVCHNGHPRTAENTYAIRGAPATGARCHGAGVARVTSSRGAVMLLEPQRRSRQICVLPLDQGNQRVEPLGSG